MLAMSLVQSADSLQHVAVQSQSVMLHVDDMLQPSKATHCIA